MGDDRAKGRDLCAEFTLEKVMNLSSLNLKCRTLMSLAVSWDFYFQNEANPHLL